MKPCSKIYFSCDPHFVYFSSTLHPKTSKAFANNAFEVLLLDSGEIYTSTKTRIKLEMLRKFANPMNLQADEGLISVLNFHGLHT